MLGGLPRVVPLMSMVTPGMVWPAPISLGPAGDLVHKHVVAHVEALRRRRLVAEGGGNASGERGRAVHVHTVEVDAPVRPADVADADRAAVAEADIAVGVDAPEGVVDDA